MSKIIINGGRKLQGEIIVEGSKNAVLPILTATVLNSGTIVNC
jgi:UDP-N-acetylglucosamine enolpyruvyl transferase